MSFTGSYTGDEPNVPSQHNIILQKKVSGVDKIVNFKDFSRTLTEFKDFSRLYKPILPSAHARTSQADILHLDQKAAKCTTCKPVCGKF